MVYLLKMVIFHGYVKLPEGIRLKWMIWGYHHDLGNLHVENLRSASSVPENGLWPPDEASEIIFTGDFHGTFSKSVQKYRSDQK